MAIKRPLAPEIINQLDESLLKNKPGIWSTRAHMTWYYSIIYFIALAFFSYISQPDVRVRSSVEVWSILVGLVSFVGFVFWLIYLLRFNVFKRYGIQDKWDGLKTFLLYFIAIAPLVFAPFIPSLVETKKANMAYSSNELAEDINNINLWANQLEKDSIPQQFSADTFIVRENQTGVAEDVDYLTSSGRPDEISRYYIDTATLRNKLESLDSVRKMNDTTYIFYEAPDYLYVTDYSVWSYSKVSPLSSKELYYKIFSIQPIDKKSTKEKLDKVVKKYSIYYNDADDDVERSYDTRIKYRYNLYEVDSNIGSITSKKYRWDDDGMNLFFHIFYYTVLLLSVAVFAFRHSTIKTFFLTLLVAFLLAILSSIFIGVSGFELVGSLGLLLFYYLLFGLFAFMGSAAGTRTALGGIAISLFLWLTPFIPLISVAFYYAELRRRYWRYNELSYDKYFNKETQHYFIAEIIGFVLLIVVIEPVFKMLYRKWYSLPEQ